MKPKDLLFDWMWRHFPAERIPPAAETLWNFLEYLQVEARNFNLTAIHDMREMVERHVIDSLAPFAAPECPLRAECAGSLLDPRAAASPDANTQSESRPAPRVIDIGSGNGLPGLALAVAFPAWRVTLLESNRKKCEFLSRAAEKIGAANVEVACERAENFGRDPARRDAHDLATARALAVLPVALELCLPLVRLGGWMLAYKGRECQAEIEVSNKAFGELGARLESSPLYPVGDSPAQHTAVWIRKTSATPERYPRRDGMPRKRPLWEKPLPTSD